MLLSEKMADSLFDGRRLRLLTVIELYTRE